MSCARIRSFLMKSSHFRLLSKGNLQQLMQLPLERSCSTFFITLGTFLPSPALVSRTPRHLIRIYQIFSLLYSLYSMPPNDVRGRLRHTQFRPRSNVVMIKSRSPQDPPPPLLAQHTPSSSYDRAIRLPVAMRLCKARKAS